MRFSLFSLFLLLLFDSFQGTTLPGERSLGELNTTLKTNIDGTYQRINPCTRKEIQSTSCVGSHKFSHNVKGENWSDYSQKCSAIIKSFLQAIGNLVRFDSTPNGTFNFHINTSITHTQTDHCDSKGSQSRRPIPTIIIEATGCEVPPPPCDSPAEKDKNTQINISQKSTTGEQNSGELITGKPNLTSQGENSFSSGGSKTSQDVTEITEITEIPAQDRTPEYQAGRFQVRKSWTPENVTPTGTAQTVSPFVPESPTMETTKAEAPTETFTEISKLGQNLDMHRPPNRPVTQPGANYVTNSLTLLPEDKFTSAAPPPPGTFDLGNPSGFAANIPEGRGFVPQRIPQPTIVDREDQFIRNRSTPVGMDQPPNDNSRQLFSDELRGQAPVSQQSANSFPSPDQIPVTNLPSTDSPNVFTDETQLERPFAFPVASSLGEPQPVELSFSKSPLPPEGTAAGPPAPNYPEHFPEQLRTTTPFPPTMVKPEFDELPGQGLVTRPPLAENNFFNGPWKPFPHDQRPPLPTPPPPTQTPVINTDYEANEGSQGLTKQTLSINQPANPENVAFAPKNSSKFSAVNNRNQPNGPQVFHDNRPAVRISQPHQQFATETVEMKRFPTNALPKPAFQPNFRERPGTSYPLNPFEHLATPKIQTPAPQFTAFPQTPPEPSPQSTANLDIPQPQPTSPYENKPLTTPAPELRSSVEETNSRDAARLPNSGYLNPQIPAPFTRPEPQLKSPVRFPSTVLRQQQTGHFNNVQPPRTTTTPEPSTTAAPESTPSFDYDRQFPNYEGVDYDYPVHRFSNSTSEHPQNPRGFVYRQFYPTAREPFRKFPPNFPPRQHPMRNPQMRHYPHTGKYKNNMKFINSTMPEYQSEYDYQYMDGMAPEQMPDYDYADYPQFPVNASHRRLPQNFFLQRHPIRNLKGNPFPHRLGKSFEAGIPTSVEKTPAPDLNPVQQHNNRNNERQNSVIINPPKILTQPETQFTGGTPPSGTLAPEEFRALQPVLTTAAYESETLTTESHTTVEPENKPPLEPVHQIAGGIQQVLDHREEQAPNESELQPRGKAPIDQTFHPRQPQPAARKFENEIIPTDFQTTGPNYQPSVSIELNNQNVRHRWVGQMPNSHNPGQQVPNGFLQPGQPFRGDAPFHRGFPVHQQPIRHFRPIFTPETPKNQSEFQSTEKPEFDNQFINRRSPGQMSNSHFAGQVPNTFHRTESPEKGDEPIFPVEQQQNFAINQPGFTTYENETVTTEFHTTVRPEYQPPAEPINQHTNEKQILPFPVSDFRGPQTPNLGQSEFPMRDNRRPGQIFPLKQHPMNFKVPRSGRGSEEKTVSRDFQTANEDRLQPHVEHDSRHIGNRWSGQRPNFQFRGQQVLNTFSRPGQQFSDGVPFLPPLPAKRQPVTILENPQPQFTTAAYEGVTTAAPEHQSSLESDQSAGIQQRIQEIQNPGPESDSQLTKSPSGEFSPASSSKQGHERNFQISQPRPISGRTHEEGTFGTSPQPSHEKVNDRAVSDFAEQQNQNNFDQSRLKASSRRFPPNISSHQSMETSETLQPNPPAQPTEEFQAPVEYNRGMPNFSFRVPQNPRPYLQPKFQPRPNAAFREFPPNFFPQQHPMRNIQMDSSGPPRKIHKNETVITEFQETKSETRNHENEFANERRPDLPRLPNRDFMNQKNPNAFGRPESQVRAHFRRFPPGMRQTDRHDGLPFVKRPPMEIPPSRGLGRIPESVPGPFSDTRTANRFVNPSNNNRPVVNRNNFQPETALMQSDRNLDYDIPTSFYNSRPTPNENQSEPQPDLMPGVRTSDEYLSATSSSETNTTSPPLQNTSVDYEDEENVPSVVSPYPGQVVNDNVTTPKPNASALYSKQITSVIISPRWQPPADIPTSEYKNSLYSQPPLPRPKPLEAISASESTEQAFGGERPPVTPVRKEFPSDFRANPDGNPARAEDTADIHEKPIERISNNPFSMPQSNSLVPRDSASAFSFQHLNQPFLNTPGNRPWVNLWTTPPPHTDSATTTFEKVTSESYGNGNIPSKSLTNPQPISVGGLQKFSPENLSPAAPFIPSNRSPPGIENPITNQPLGPPQDFPAPVGQSRAPPASRTSISIPSPHNFNQPEQQKPVENRNGLTDTPHPLAVGLPNHPTPSTQSVLPIYRQQQNNQPQNPYQVQRTPERNFNSEEQQMAILSRQPRKPEVPQQLSDIPALNRQSDRIQTAEVQKMASEQPKREQPIGTAGFPPQSQPQDVPFSQPNHQNFSSANSFVTLPSVNQQSNTIHINQRSPIQISSDLPRPQVGSEVEPQSVISGDFNLRKTPAASPQLPQPKTSNQRISKFPPQIPSPKLTTVTYEEVTTTTGHPQPTYHNGIPVQLLRSPVNAPTRLPDTPRQVRNPDFVHPVTEPASSQLSPPYVDEITPTFQTNFEAQYVRDKISTNSPPPVAKPQPQPSFAHTAIQNYETTERPVLKLKPKTPAIAGPENQENSINAENSNRQRQPNLNVPPPNPTPPDQHYTAATSLKTSEMVYIPIASLQEKHDKRPAQDSLEFIADNSPQSRPTAVKYPEKTQTAEYEPSPIPRPQPQPPALTNSGTQTEDNSANVWADQQQQIISSPEKTDTQSQLPPQHIGTDSHDHHTTPRTHKSKTTETYEQEIITTYNPHRPTPEPALIPGDKASPFTAPPPQSVSHETALSLNQQIAAATGGQHATPQIAESQPTIPKYQATPLDHPAPFPPPESIYSGRDLRKPQSGSLVLVPLSQEHPNSETKEEVFVMQKTATAPPPKQSVTEIPDTLTSTEHKSVTLVRNPPAKTKIVEEIVTTELPKNIVNSPASVQFAFAEQLLNYEDKKLSNLQQVTTPFPVVENNYSSTPPGGSSSYSEQISNRPVVFGGDAFPKNFERDNEQLEGRPSPPGHVFTSTPERPRQVTSDNPTSSFDDYDQQRSTRSPDLFPECDEIPPNFNARTALTEGHPDEKSREAFPTRQPSAALPQLSVISRRTTPLSSDFLASKQRNDVRQPVQDATATPQPGFLPSASTPSNLQERPTTERFTSFSRPGGSFVRSMSGGKA